MGPEFKYKPREEWPDWITRPLAAVGIGRFETVETIRPKIEALGLKIVAMSEDHGGLLSTYPLYYAAVIDPNDEDSIRGEYSSATDFAEALAWATARVLGDREQRKKRHAEWLASDEPADYSLMPAGLGPSVAAARSLGIAVEGAPSADYVAEVRVGEEVVARVEMPVLRGTDKWDGRKETQMLLAISDIAKTCDLKGRSGSVTLVLNPGEPNESRLPVQRERFG